MNDSEPSPWPLPKTTACQALQATSSSTPYRANNVEATDAVQKPSKSFTTTPCLVQVYLTVLQQRDSTILPRHSRGQVLAVVLYCCRIQSDHGESQSMNQITKCCVNSIKAQTPQQRRANEKYARQEAAKRGRAESERQQRDITRSPISPLWIGTIPRTGF